MARTIDLAAEVGKILDKYADDLTVSMKDAAKEVARKGVQKVRENARGSFGGTGEYAKGWKSKVTEGRLSTSAVIYNKDAPGLPHLLEHGHAKRGGGRVEGRVHIKPVEDELVESFERAIRRDA